MAGKKGGRKKAYYERQKLKTETNKKRRAAKRAAQAKDWLLAGKKKNGKPVLTKEIRAKNKAEYKYDPRSGTSTVKPVPKAAATGTEAKTA